MKTFKHALWAIAFFMHMAGMSVIESFPDGRFFGIGVWYDDNDNSGIYELYYTFMSNNLRADFLMPTGPMTVNLSFDFVADGSFDIFFDNNIVGYGSCDDEKCFMNYSIDSIFVRNTLYLAEDRYIDIGFKVVDCDIINWQNYLWRLP